MTHNQEQADFWNSLLKDIDVSALGHHAQEELHPNTNDEDDTEKGILLSTDELDRVIINAHLQNRDGVAPIISEDQMVELVRWAEHARLGEILLTMVLEGRVRLGFNDQGEPTFLNSTPEEQDQLMTLFSINEVMEGDEDYDGSHW